MGTKVTKLVRLGKIGALEDAKKPIFIEVTEVDCVRGERFAPDQCVLAKATNRSVPNAIKSIVYECGAYAATYNPKTKKDKTLRWIPSAEARKAIATFDETGKFPPGRYRLDAPTGSNTLKAIRERSRNRRGRHQPGNTKIKRRPVDIETHRHAKRKGRRARLQVALAY
jgi:hypothetical protein